MQAILLDAPGGTYRLVDDITKPVPGSGQILVKSLVTAINPVYAISFILSLFQFSCTGLLTKYLTISEPFMQQTGMLVTHWPIVLGCDASGVVVEVGEGVKRFKTGDGVFGCTNLGTPSCGTFQEFVCILQLNYDNELGGVVVTRSSILLIHRCIVPHGRTPSL